MEDDWNDGQHLTIKAKNKINNNEFAHTFKAGEARMELTSFQLRRSAR